jgi:hypothetical protein
VRDRLGVPAVRCLLIATMAEAVAVLGIFILIVFYLKVLV